MCLSSDGRPGRSAVASFLSHEGPQGRGTRERSERRSVDPLLAEPRGLQRGAGAARRHEARGAPAEGCERLLLISFFALIYQLLLIEDRMNIDELRTTVRERYGAIAERAASGEAGSCCNFAGSSRCCGSEATSEPIT